MTKYIVFTDPHIEESCLEELEQVFREISWHSKGRPVLVCVGDYYEKKNPSAREIAFGTKWAMTFKKAFADFIMVAGNHPAVDATISGVSYLEYLGITVVEDIELEGTYYGHYMVKESLCGFNESHEGTDLANKHKLSILGHQHSFQIIKWNDINGIIVHPGSVRYVDFGEAGDKGKYILVVEDADFQEIRLNNVRQMIEVDSVKKLASIPREAQVRVVYTDFNAFVAEADSLEKLKSTFFKFKVKFNFNNTPQINQVNLNTSNTEIITKWLNNIQNAEVKAELEAEFKKSGKL